MPPAKKRKASQKTVTVITGQRYVTRVRVGDETFPVGEPVKATEQTISALQEMPGVTVDVAGEPDVDTPEPPAEE